MTDRQKMLVILAVVTNPFVWVAVCIGLVWLMLYAMYRICEAECRTPPRRVTAPPEPSQPTEDESLTEMAELKPVAGFQVELGVPVVIEQEEPRPAACAQDTKSDAVPPPAQRRASKPAQKARKLKPSDESPPGPTPTRAKAKPKSLKRAVKAPK